MHYLLKNILDISPRMRYDGKRSDTCNHFCKNQPYNGHYFKWFTYIDNKYIRTMCMKCALRETWGYNYKQQKNYKKWREQCSF